MSTHLIKHIYKNVVFSGQEFVNWALQNKIEFVDSWNNVVFTVTDSYGNCSDNGRITPLVFYKIVGKQIYFGLEKINIDRKVTWKIL